MRVVGVKWWVGMLLVLHLSVSFCFVLSEEEGEKSSDDEAHPLPGVIHPSDNSSSSNVAGAFKPGSSQDGVLFGNNTPQALPLPGNLTGTNSSALGDKPQHHDTYHHHQWGHKACHHHHNGTEHNHTTHHHECHNATHGNHHEHDSEKVEQILWDIFVEDDLEEEAGSDEGDDLQNDDDDDASDNIYRSSQESESVAVLEEDEREPEVDVTQQQHKISRRDVNGTTESGRGARKSSAKKQHASSKKGSSSQRNKKHSSSSSVTKYNEYMDVVLKRMNTMIKTKKMDPLMVNLFSGAGAAASSSSPGKNKGGGKSKGGKKKRKGAKSNRARMDLEDEEEASHDDDDDDGGRSEDVSVELDNAHEEEAEDNKFMRRDVFLNLKSGESGSSADEDEEETEEDEARGFRQLRALILRGSMQRSGNSNNNKTANDQHDVSTVDNPTDKQETRGFAGDDSDGKKLGNSGKGKKNKASGKKKPEQSNNPANKKKNSKKPGKATRGILKGLSSLRRTGNVDVIRQNDKVRIVRSKFFLGPVTLEIVPRKGKLVGKSKSSPSSPQDKPDSSSSSTKVTAVAQQLKGIIEVRLKKNSPTSIKRLRVFPPSSVKLKSPPASKASSSTSKKKKTQQHATSSSTLPRYSRVTPVATHRLRQIATAVVRQADLRRKGNRVQARNNHDIAQQV